MPKNEINLWKNSAVIAAPILCYPRGRETVTRYLGDLKSPQEEKELALKDYAARYGWSQAYLEKEIEK